MGLLVGAGISVGVSFDQPSDFKSSKQLRLRHKQSAWDVRDLTRFGLGNGGNGVAQPLYFRFVDSLVAIGSSHGVATERAIDSNTFGNTGWALGTSVGYALMTYGSQASIWAAPAQPAGTPTTNDCYRSENVYTGTFAAGTWTLSISMEAQHASGGTAAIIFRIWRSTDPSGLTGCVEVTSGAVATASQGTSSSPSTMSITASLSAATLVSEYLFFQIAAQSMGPGVTGADFQVMQNSQAATAPDVTTPVFTSGAVTSNADANITLDAATLSSTGAVDIAAAASISLGAATLSADGTVASAGNNAALAVTLGAATLSSAGTVAIAAAESSTLGAATLSAAGQVAIAGTLTKTLGAATLAATGTAAIAGTLTKTLGAATLSSAGAVTIAGALTRTLSPATLASAGQLAIAGASATTLGAATLAAAGVVGSIPITGDAAIHLAPATLSASGTIAIAAASSNTLGAATLTASGTVAITAALSNALGAATLAASAAAAINGALSSSLGAATLASSGTVSAPIVDTSVADQVIAAEIHSSSTIVADAQSATLIAIDATTTTAIADSTAATTYITGENPS